MRHFALRQGCQRVPSGEVDQAHRNAALFVEARSVRANNIRLMDRIREGNTRVSTNEGTPRNLL